MTHHKASFDADYGPYRGAWGDPRNDDEGGLEPCIECEGDGCACCDDKGYFMGEEPMSKTEFDKLCEEASYPS